MTTTEAYLFANVLHAVGTGDLVRTFWREAIVARLQSTGLVTAAVTLTPAGEKLLKLVPASWVETFD